MFASSTPIVTLSSSLTEDDMTSTRGQNVSVLQLRETQPLELPETARRAAPISSFKIESNGFTNGKSLNQHPIGNYLSEAYSPGRSFSRCSLNSDISCGASGELSPVHWCDRDADEVYLGRSGWVQVQQRSMEDSGGTPCGQSSGRSALRPRKLSSNINSYVNSLGRREQNRPVSLPLSSSKSNRTNLGNHKMPYAFTQELVTVPPSLVTPILSPPPAFRDEQTDIEIPAPVQPTRKPFHFEDSLWIPRPVADSEDSSGSTLPSISASKHYSRPCLQTKSLDEEVMERTASPFTLLAFRSFDNDFRKISSGKVSDSNPVYKSVHTSEKRGKIVDQEDSEIDEGDRGNCSTKHSTTFQTSSRDRLNPQRDVPSIRRQRRFQLNGKRISVSESASGNRTRSPSLDSSSSSSSDNSAGGRSLRMNSRRFTAKQCQSQGDHFTGGLGKHYGVKRSRSLQLSEERPSHEPMSMSHSSSGKSWDQVPSECATFHTKNDYNRHHSQSFRNLHNVMFAVNGQGIPVVSNSGHSPNPLNEITTSEEEQLKLIREAAKEAKVISEFLSGTKSRAAARSLLMHRYFNRPEAAASDFSEGDAFPKPQSDSRFLPSPRPHKFAPVPWNDARPNSSSRDTRRHADHTKPPTPSTRLSNTPAPLQNLRPFHNHPHPPRNHSDNSYEALPVQVTALRSKRTRQQQPFMSMPLLPSPEKPSAAALTQKQGSDPTKHRTTRKFQSPPAGVTVTTFFENVTENPVTLDDFRRRFILLDALRQNSSTSSSSTDAPQNHFHNLTANAYKASTTSDLSLDSLCLHSESFASDDNFPTPHLFHHRPASAPETYYTSLPVHRKFLSLPRSFLSEHYAPNYFARRNSFPRRKHQQETLDEYADECPGKSTASATLPTTPVRHPRNDRSTKAPTCKKPSCVPPSNESALVRVQWTGQRQPAAASCWKHRERKLRNRASTCDDGGSHERGTHLGIRRNVESAGSRDDGPLAGGPHQEIKTPINPGRDGVRTWDVQDHHPRPASYSSPSRDLQTTSWSSFTNDLARLTRVPRGQLRRSLSLNELAPGGTQSSSRPQCRALSEDENNSFQGNSDDELSSDSESSERNHSLHSAQKEETVGFAEALWDHIAFEPFELSFRAGDVIEVLDTSDRHWWWGATAQNSGYFPSAFVRLRMTPPDTVTPIAFETSASLRRSKSPLLSSEQVRSNVVKELLNTERDFVKILRGIKEGYMAQCSRRPDMFTSAQINTIFGNLVDILVFQEEFLKDLEGRIDEEFPHRSCVGEVFLNHSSGFRMYSEYCNFHPMAMAELQELYRKDKYRKFFEMCRLKQNLSEIPLDGYLLTPVQRICKYPLQLAELLKYTKLDHPDIGNVEKALETMKSVATLINERKRKMERLEKLAAWQRRVEGWEGDDLIELSSQLIYQGDVVKITSGMWTTNITLFLFDHQMIYCKKDLLKRHDYIYKGRICLDGSEVVDLADGKNQQLGVTIRYGIRIGSNSKEKWLVFCCRSSEDKEKWLSALAEEKRVVARDKEVDLDLPPTAKHLAKMGAMATKKTIPNKPRGKNKRGPGREEMSGVRDGPLSNVKVKGGRRMGTWFTFGGAMRSPKISLRQRGSFQQIT